MDFFMYGIPGPLALAAVAVLGYLFGRRQRQETNGLRSQSRREMKRAKAVIRDMEDIAKTVRASLASHHASILNFKDRVESLSSSGDEQAWKKLCDEAERMLKPTMRLAGQISNAYDEIRQQTNRLMTFTEIRVDPLTGLANRRAFDESLQAMFAMMSRYRTHFTVGLFDIDHFKKINDEWGHLEGDEVLQKVARLIDFCARETDVVVRYGGEEFVVLMPHTDIKGASIFADRLRRTVEQSEDVPVTISGGVAAAMDGDNPRTILARADSALYSAKAGGRNAVFRHDGTGIEGITGFDALDTTPRLDMEDVRTDRPESEEDAPTVERQVAEEATV
jgi:diguanylate cyclase